MRIIQFFNWRLVDIMDYVLKVKEQGFDAIQINPIQPLKEDGLKEWWMSYQPIDFAIGNFYGTKEDLIQLCCYANKNNIRIFADVVINHMGGSVENNLVPHSKVAEKLRSNPLYWRPQKNVYNWHDRQEVIHNCMGLPGLNVYHQDVEDMIVKYLNELIDCGITGFRFDAAKSIGLPSEGYRFWPNVIYRLKKYGLFLYGEVIFEEDIKVLDEYTNYMNILGNYDATDKDKMVKFIESHDTFLSNDSLGYTRYLSSEEIVREYQKIAYNYVNTLFYARPFDNSWQCNAVREANFFRKNNSLVRAKNYE